MREDLGCLFRGFPGFGMRMKKARLTAPRRIGREAGPRNRIRIFIAKGDEIRTLHISRRQIAAGLLVGFAFSALYFGAAIYLILRGSSSLGPLQTVEVQDAYEDRIAALRNEIDRIRSAGMIDHTTVARKVDEVIEHQRTLDARQGMLAAITDAARRAGFEMPALTLTPAAADNASTSPAPKNFGFSDMDLRSERQPSQANDRAAAAERLSHIDSRLAIMADDQTSVVDSMANRVTLRANKIALTLKRLGRPVPIDDNEDVGGPFVPLPNGTDESAFQASVGTLSGELSRLAEIRRIAMALPLRQPIPDAIITSPFGPRLDPFLGRPGMHTGIDFRAMEGSPACSVAAGTVIAAEYNVGGYGNMVDIDHGNGVVTRYGHLSAITVRVGEKVAAGAAIGRIGETGRATGPHLHYEIRVDGQPIDPERYLRAGKEISSLL